MRWYELEEAVQSRLREPIEGAVTLATTKRFDKEFASFVRKFPNLVYEFDEFLTSKIADIDKPFGKKDTQWSGGAVAGLTGWWHAHLLFGQIMIIYRPVGKKLVLASVTDHLSVEGKGLRIRSLGEYLSKVNLEDDPSLKSIKAKPNLTTDIDTNTLRQEIGLGNNVSQAKSQSMDVEKAVRDFMYQVASNPTDRAVLQNFVQGRDVEEFEIFLELGELPPSYKKMPMLQLQQLGAEVLKQTGARI